MEKRKQHPEGSPEESARPLKEAREDSEDSDEEREECKLCGQLFDALLQCRGCEDTLWCLACSQRRLLKPNDQDSPFEITSPGGLTSCYCFFCTDVILQSHTRGKSAGVRFTGEVVRDANGSTDCCMCERDILVGERQTLCTECHYTRWCHKCINKRVLIVSTRLHAPFVLHTHPLDLQVAYCWACATKILVEHSTGKDYRGEDEIFQGRKV